MLKPMSRPFLMSTFGWVVGALTLTGCIPSGTNSAIVSAGQPGLVFPQVVGINLDGDSVTVPDDLEGELNLVAVAFERNQQVLVDTWIAEADRLSERYPGLRFYEVPTIYQAQPLFRLWVNNGMRSGITDSTARRRTVTVYVDREQFIHELAIPDLSDIHVLLLDDSGRVLWRAAGPADDESIASLSAWLDTRSRHTWIHPSDRRTN